MKYPRALACLCFLWLPFFSTSGLHAAGARDGDVLYTPTRMEWAELTLRAKLPASGRIAYLIFVQDSKKIRILIDTEYSVPLHEISLARSIAEQAVDALKRKRGFEFLEVEIVNPIRR